MLLKPGDEIGAYRIEKQLGSGGMATVYKAHHDKLDRAVAIKMMHEAMLQDPNFTARFEREARIVARLEHQNIVQIYDFSDHEGRPYLVMKHIDGQTLKRRLRQGVLSLDEIRQLMRSIGAALDYAHERGVLHRDIKPSNIILDVSDKPYLTDFGLARMATSGESTMSADVMLGTPYYISPEQAKGGTDLDARTDVYSLGIILYELLVGRVPFMADTPYATVHDHIYSSPPPLRDLNPEITPPVEAVVLKALAKNPNDRYDSAGALVQAFEVALADSGLQRLDPNRASRVAPRPETPPPAARVEKPKLSQPPRPDRPPTPKEGEEYQDFEQRIEAWAEELGRRAEQWGRNLEERFNSGDNRWSWRPGAEWRQTPNGDWGFYTDDDIQAMREQEANLPPEERARRFVEKKIEERGNLVGHVVAYVIVNTILWTIFLSSGGGFPWPIFVTGGWGIGVISNIISYNNEFGSGRERRERLIQQEIAREQTRLSGVYGKLKNEDLAEYDDREIRLTGDGELTDSFIDELDADKRRRRR